MARTSSRAVAALVCLVLLLTGCATGSGEAPPRASATEAAPVTSVADKPTAPDLVGMRLPEARETLRTDGYAVDSEVPEGDENRPIVEPVNWVVTAQDPAAGTPVEAGTRFSLTVAKPTDDTSAGQVTESVVPEVVCLDLQKAQDALRAAGFYVLTSSDASGQGRQQLVDRNWVVVTQSEPAGSSPNPTTRIDLGTVKLGEPTGASDCPS
jgi:beta-lactam-binding protein with PASTA domain